MGKFLSPPSPISYQTKCAVILYPADDGGFFLDALRGQLSELGRGYVWEGDRAKREEIAQIWVNHDLMTDAVFFKLNCEDVPLVTGEESMDINVNVNCGCCGSAGSNSNLVCYDSAGNEIITPGPYTPEPKNPAGGDWPMIPGEDTPPSDFSDWTEYDQNACQAINRIYKLIELILVAAVGIVDLAERLAYVLLTFAGLFPAAVASSLGSAFLLRAVEALIAVADRADDVKDWLTEALGYIRDNQQEIVCMMYAKRYDIPGLKTSLRANIVSWVVGVFTLDTGDTAILFNVIDKLLPVNVFMDWLTKAEAWVNLTITPVDCALCSGSFTWAVNTNGTGGTMTVNESGDDFVIASGLTAVVGSTEVQAGVGILEGMRPVTGSATCQAISFYANEISDNYAGGGQAWQAGVNHQLDIFGTTMGDNNPIISKTVLLKRSGYTGPTAGYDLVLNSADATGGIPVMNPTSPGTWFARFVRVAVPQTQYACVFDIISLRMLDSSGNVLEVEPVS